MDEASGELLSRLIGRANDRPWLLVVTRRDVETGFVTPEGTTCLRLAPLVGDEAVELVRWRRRKHPCRRTKQQRSPNDPAAIRCSYASSSR